MTNRNMGGNGRPPPKIDGNGNENFIHYTQGLNFDKLAHLFLVLIVGIAYLHNYHLKLIIGVLYSLSGIIVVGVSFAGILIFWYGLERIKMVRARRIDLEKQAHTLIIQSGDGQVYLRDTASYAPIKALHLATSEKNARQWHIFNSKKAIPLLDELPEGNAPEPHLLDILQRADRVLIKGQSGAGKTNVLCHVANERLKRGDVFIIDPHSSPNKWGTCQVLGAGADFSEIDTAMVGFITEMGNRYKQLSTGESREADFKPLCIIIDEFMSIALQCNEAKNTLVRLITESRKANFSLFIGTHSDRVESLGLKGMGDIRQGLTFVNLLVENFERSATIDTGNGPAIAKIPPKFERWERVSSQHESILSLPVAADPPPLQPTAEDLKIYGLRSSGLSYNKTCKKIYNSTGGRQIAMIKEAVNRVEKYQNNNEVNGHEQ